MNVDPIRRRYGYGAARLPIGGASSGPTLSELAQTRVSHENAFAAAPALACAAVSVLLALTLRLAPVDESLPTPATLAASTATQTPTIVELWDEAPTPQVAPTPVAEAPLFVAEQSVEPPLVDGEAQEAAPSETAAPFDVGALAMRAPDASFSPAPADPERRAADPHPQRARPKRDHALRPAPPLDIPALGRSVSLPVLAEVAPAAGPARDSVRPGGRAATTPGSTRALTSWSADPDRRAFLAAQAADAASDSQAMAAASGGRRSPVSAAAPGRAISQSVRNDLVAGGWQEIPLDTLPDCSPRGRQDQLKKRILLAAPFEQACSHRDGSYRFVETRNLGAFLMWSRPNPDGFIRPQRDRDVCDVLERALRCLAVSSIEES